MVPSTSSTKDTGNSGAFVHHTHVSTCTVTSASTPLVHMNTSTHRAYPKSNLRSAFTTLMHGSVSAATATSGFDMDKSNEESIEIERLRPTADEPNLLNIPSSINPEYQPLPFILKLLLGLVSILTSTRIHSITRTAMRTTIQQGSRKISSRFNMKLILTIFSSFFLSTTIVQDLFYAPSRIAASTLSKNQWLPSTLSLYKNVHPEPGEENNLNVDMKPLGVHYLKYDNTANFSDNTDFDYKFDAIHFNHGFGASSLSWLPAIPSLVKKLGGKVGIAHDAPGFGFTDRPPASGRKGGLVPYTSAGCAAIGNALISSHLRDSSGENEKKELKSVCLFGHSMGSATTLKMALSLPKDCKKTIVLVAPALIGDAPNKNKNGGKQVPLPLGNNAPVGVNEADSNSDEIVMTQDQSTKLKDWLGIPTAALRALTLDQGVHFILKRAVG